MAAAELLAIGTNSTPSSDVVVTSSGLTVCLKDAAGPFVATGAQVEIRLKDDAGQYFTIDTLTNGKPGAFIAAAGTYQFIRRAAVSCGVFSG